MSFWGGYRGWGGLTWQTSNQAQQANNGWWESFEKFIKNDWLFAIQDKVSGRTVKIVWALACWKDKDSDSPEGQARRENVSKWNEYGRNEEINAWNDHNDKSVYLGSATISIVPILTLQDINCLAFTARQLAGCRSFHGSGGGGGGTSFTFFSKGVTEFYRSTIIHGSITWQDSRLYPLLFIQFIFYMFYDFFHDPFVLMVHIVYLK